MQPDDADDQGVEPVPHPDIDALIAQRAVGRLLRQGRGNTDDARHIYTGGPAPAERTVNPSRVGRRRTVEACPDSCRHVIGPWPRVLRHLMLPSTQVGCSPTKFDSP